MRQQPNGLVLEARHPTSCLSPHQPDGARSSHRAHGPGEQSAPVRWLGDQPLKKTDRLPLGELVLVNGSFPMLTNLTRTETSSLAM
jgi:hypothetical protein